MLHNLASPEPGFTPSPHDCRAHDSATPGNLRLIYVTLHPQGRESIAAESLPHFESEAKKRQAARTDIQEKIPESSHAQSRDQAAAQVGVNARYVSDAKKIKEESPETFDFHRGRV